MKRFISYTLLIISCILLFAGCKKKNNEDFLPCLSLKENETVNIVQFMSFYGNWTPVEAAQNLKELGQCVNARPGDDGLLIVTHNKQTLEQEHERIVGLLKDTITRAGNVTVSSDCNKVTYSIDETITTPTFMNSFMAILPSCLLLQLYSGIPYEEVNVQLKIIYNPTGKTMYDVNVSYDNSLYITDEEWTEKLEEVK